MAKAKRRSPRLKVRMGDFDAHYEDVGIRWEKYKIY
jgi:hypothetical protein